MCLVEQGAGVDTHDLIAMVGVGATEVQVATRVQEDGEKWTGTLGGNRTPNLLVRSQTLYPLSYEGIVAKSAGKYSSRKKSPFAGTLTQA